MRYREFELTEDELFELKMSPTNLSKMAKNIDARVGMEFELIVPNAQGEEENEFESEPDYDADESFPTGPGWQRDIIDFFRGGEMGNSTRSIQRAIDELNENFYAWVDEDREEYIASADGVARAREIALDNINQDDYDSPEALRAAIQEYLDENEDDIRETLIDEYNDDLDSKFEEWLDDNGIGMMSDFANEHSLEWPYWTEPDDYYGGRNVSINDVADDFSQAIGRPVNASASYHGATRRPGHYVVEPDSSLHGEPGDGGLEFVSPPLTVDEMLSDIDKVAAWAGRVGAYTNDSTGLHMNVSVPGQQNLDFVKLAMFLGDNYILEQFGREGNTYCKSILKQIVGVARSEPGRVEEMMRQFQGGLNQLASKVLHTGSTGKYSSINNRGDWIEFRGPGGDWLGDDLSAVKNTMLRAVVALDVATKPEEFKQEYYKKLYKTLAQGKEDDTIQYFAKYAAGELPQTALKSFVRQIQGKRKIEKMTHGAKDILLVWKVTGDRTSPYQSQGTEVLGKTQLDAYVEAIKQWRLNLGSYSIEEWAQEHGWRAQPLRPATSDDMNAMSDKFYRVYPEGSSQGVWVKAMSEFQAKQLAVQRFSDIFANVAASDIIAAHDRNYSGPETPYNLRARLGEPQPIWREPPTQQTPSREQEFTGYWEIVRRSTDEVISVMGGIGNSVADAERHLARWQQQTGFNDPVYVRPLMREIDNVPRNQGEVERSEYRVDYTVTHQDETRNNSMTVPAANADAAMAAVRNRLERAGWTIDRIEAEPASSAARGTESLPPGNTRWLVLDQNDREVYSFVHRNNQAEANQYAANWLRSQGLLGSGEFMVVPAR